MPGGEPVESPPRYDPSMISVNQPPPDALPVWEETRVPRGEASPVPLWLEGSCCLFLMRGLIASSLYHYFCPGFIAAVRYR